MNTMCTVSLVSHLRAVADLFHPLRTTEQLRCELNESEVILMASTLVVVKTENI